MKRLAIRIYGAVLCIWLATVTVGLSGTWSALSASGSWHTGLYEDNHMLTIPFHSTYFESGFTVELFCNQNTPYTGSFAALLDIGGDSYRWRLISIKKDSGYYELELLRLQYGEPKYSSSKLLNQNTYHHIVAKFYDYQSNDGYADMRFKLYIDGEQHLSPTNRIRIDKAFNQIDLFEPNQSTGMQTLAGVRLWRTPLRDWQISGYNHRLLCPSKLTDLVVQSGWGVTQTNQTKWYSTAASSEYASIKNTNCFVMTNIASLSVQDLHTAQFPWNTVVLNKDGLPAFLSLTNMPQTYDYTSEILFTVPEIGGHNYGPYILSWMDNIESERQIVSVSAVNINRSRNSYQLLIKEWRKDKEVGRYMIPDTLFAGTTYQLTLIHKGANSSGSMANNATISYSLNGADVQQAFSQTRNSTSINLHLGYNDMFPETATTPVRVHGFRHWSCALSQDDIQQYYRRYVPAEERELLCQCGWDVDQASGTNAWHDTTPKKNDLKAEGLSLFSSIECHVGVIGPFAINYQGQFLEDDTTPASVPNHEAIAVIEDANAREIWQSRPRPLNADSNGLFSFMCEDLPTAATNAMLQTALQQATNALFLGFKVKDTSSIHNPYESVYPSQPLLSVPYALKADNMESADDFEVVGGDLTIMGDATFDTLEVNDIQARDLIASNITADSLSAEAFGFTSDVVHVTADTVFHHLIITNHAMHSLLSAAPKAVTINDYKPDLPQNKTTKWWKQINQDGFLYFTAERKSTSYKKAIVVCAKQYDSTNAKNPSTIYSNWTKGVYDSDLLMVYEVSLTNGTAGMTVPVSAGMYIAFLSQMNGPTLYNVFNADGTTDYKFVNGWFNPLGNQ